ncbi:sensor histidine kinase [Sporolactobacillus pectinivorans]|uniref:sensor histidine kinase n=1 Tax=Sporolactobacillus pectinivorans TaxID=1591408 RepID=UPI000C2638B5|nr:HAMP domain-containing sensor histidine kinase [Sporolactobacillus pectinivorans]
MKSDYRQLKIRILVQILATILLTGMAGIFLCTVLVDGIFQKPFADAVLAFFQTFFSMNEYSAIYYYQQIFVFHKVEILIVAYFILLLFSLSAVLTKVVHYFDQVSKGVDQLLIDSEQPIILKPELSSMQVKLNKVKSILIERKKSAAESEQRKNDLVVYLAHDLKTPLTSVIGYLSLLQEADDLPDAQRKKYTAIALNKALRLEDLINEFFEITRFNLQNIELEQNKINISLMLNQLADEFYPIFEPKNMKAVVQSDDLVITGDANKLARVFNNLLKNAVTYGYEDSTIEISAEKRDGRTDISFKNRGDKISGQQLDHIFEKFYRLDAARSSHTGGTGLGLAIAKKIVEQHQGTIAASSNEHFTEFVVSFPQ